METNTEKVQIYPPRLVPTLAAGFNLIANNVRLMLFPIGMELLIWFGPHFRLKTLLQPIINDMTLSLTDLSKPDTEEMVKAIQSIWQATLDQFNIISVLRTYPIGIPSLFASQGSLKTPLGDVRIFEISSISNAFLFWIVLSLTGILLGTIYFNEVARLVNKNHDQFSTGSIILKYFQVLILTITLIIILMIITIPTSILLTIAATVNLFLAQIALLIITFLLIWLLFPLFFSPHGIFVNNQNVLVSILNSVRLVRFFLPGTGLLIMTILFISQGLNALWRLAPATSWMALIGMVGHAFTATGLLAATFVYYRDGIAWMEENLKRMAASRQSDKKPNLGQQ